MLSRLSAVFIAVAFCASARGQQLEAILTSPYGDDRPYFAHELDMDGSLLALGDSWHDIGGISSAGFAFVYRRAAPGTWVLEAQLAPPHPRAYGLFGHALAVSGDTLAVAEPNVNGAGRIHVYRRDALGSWSHEQELFAPGSQARDFFGGRIALQGDALVANAVNHLPSGQPVGRVHVFERSGDGQFSLAAELMPDPADSACFGVDVAIRGDTILTSAVFSGDDARSCIYVFQRGDHGGWSRAALLMERRPEAEPFGYRVALGEDFALGTTYDWMGWGAFTAATFVEDAGNWQRSSPIGAIPQEVTSLEARGPFALLGFYTFGFETVRPGAALFRLTTAGWSERTWFDSVQGGIAASAGSLAAVAGFEPGHVSQRVFIYDIGGCLADVNDDGAVGIHDLATLLSHFGATASLFADGDLNGDARVSFDDLSTLLAAFGGACP